MSTATATLSVTVHADDPISRSGIEACLGANYTFVEDPEADDGAVAIVAVEDMDEPAVRLLRRLRRSEGRGVVLVVSRIDDHGLFSAIEAGVSAIVRRSDATLERLGEAIRHAAEGNASLPPDLLSRLMGQVATLNADLADRGPMLNGGLSEREIEVLRMVADGRGTSEIANELCYSERTIKNVIQGITTRLQLRNRSHAVAYALRHGLL